MDASQVAILDEVADLQVFKGNQIVRLDERVRLHAGEIFMLPLDLQMRFSQLLSGLGAILRAFLLAGKAAMQGLELLLGLAQIARILDGVAVRIGAVGTDAYINAFLFACGDMLNYPVSLDGKLHVVAISTSHDANPLDLLRGEGFNVLFGIADQAKATNPTAIGEGDVFAIRFQLPSLYLIFYTAVIMLESGIALLARCVQLAILIETGDGKPGTIGTSLTGLLIETGGKTVLFGQRGTVALQIILGGTTLIHPLAQALIPDELDNPNRFIEGLILPLTGVNLVFVDEHRCLAFRLCFCYFTSEKGVSSCR